MAKRIVTTSVVEMENGDDENGDFGSEDLFHQQVRCIYVPAMAVFALLFYFIGVSVLFGDFSVFLFQGDPKARSRECAVM